jgi:uncharacterized membrane protein
MKLSDNTMSSSVRIWPPREDTGLAAGDTVAKSEEFRKDLTIMSKPSGVAIGAIAGLLFGMFIILYGVGAALILLVFAILGAAIGWLIQNVSTGHLDVRGAWKALYRE